MNPRALEETTVRIEAAIQERVAGRAREKFHVTHYGANDIHPRHLVYWVCVLTDAERDRLQGDEELARELRQLLVDHDYPEEGRSGVHMGFESEETVRRDSGGNWWHHWK